MHAITNSSKQVDEVIRSATDGLYTDDTTFEDMITHPNGGDLDGQLDHLSRLGVPLPNSLSLQAFREMSIKPWFTRSWTWQEHCIARNPLFRYGAISFSREFFWDTLNRGLGLKQLTLDEAYNLTATHVRIVSEANLVSIFLPVSCPRVVRNVRFQAMLSVQSSAL